jgi:hypothetical protein
MLRRVALIRTDVVEEYGASIIRVTRIGEIGMLAVTSNRRKPLRYTMKNTPKRWFLQEPHIVNIPEDIILHSHRYATL